MNEASTETRRNCDRFMVVAFFTSGEMGERLSSLVRLIVILFQGPRCFLPQPVCTRTSITLHCLIEPRLCGAPSYAIFCCVFFHKKTRNRQTIERENLLGDGTRLACRKRTVLPVTSMTWLQFDRVQTHTARGETAITCNPRETLGNVM